MTPPERHWQSYIDEPLPTTAEALGAPLRAFPSWFLRIECYRRRANSRPVRWTVLQGG